MSPVIKVASFPKNLQSQPKVARHLDSLGFTVFAGCLDTASFLWVVENCTYDVDPDDDNAVDVPVMLMMMMITLV